MEDPFVQQLRHFGDFFIHPVRRFPGTDCVQQRQIMIAVAVTGVNIQLIAEKAGRIAEGKDTGRGPSGAADAIVYRVRQCFLHLVLHLRVRHGAEYTEKTEQ